MNHPIDVVNTNTNTKYINTLYGNLSQLVYDKMKEIKLLICDVDGVFSDGRIYMGNQGEELKTFHVWDGYGIKMLLQADIHIAIITGRQSNIVENRMAELGIKHVYQGQKDKRTAYKQLQEQFNIPADQIAYIGDDLIDLPVMNLVGLAISVADGHPLLKQHLVEHPCHYLTQTRGGFGAVREIADLILLSKDLLETYQGTSI